MKMNKIEAIDEDFFKPAFKYYKSKAPPPKLDDLVDPQKGNELLGKVEPLPNLIDHPFLIDSTLWKISKMGKGIFLVSNPFKNEGVAYWTLRCMKDFSDSKNNLKNETNWWGEVQDNPKLINKLRWATLGFHHDWDTKVYSECGDFPQDLANLSKAILNQIGELKSDPYKAEAAIINYYPMDSTLSGHVDFSEPNKTAPLISISFGQNAIFLIGGPTKSEKPNAILLRNGDVLIMSHKARQSYHAVPKILKSDTVIEVPNTFVKEYLSNHRINMNVRQVF